MRPRREKSFISFGSSVILHGILPGRGGFPRQLKGTAGGALRGPTLLNFREPPEEEVGETGSVLCDERKMC